MIAETEPHRVSILDEHGRWVKTKMSHFPPEIDPFGEIPIEAEIIRNQVMFNLDYFRRILGSGLGIPSPEGNVNVFLNREDDSGRTYPVEVRINYTKTRVESRSEIMEVETYRLSLYENGIGVRSVENWVFGHNRLSETVLSQKYITEEDLHLLDYARMIISQSSIAPIK